MYLSVFIYLNHVPFGASQQRYGFKSMDKFETSQTNFKFPSGRTIFLVLHTKVWFLVCNLESNFEIFITLDLLILFSFMHFSIFLEEFYIIVWKYGLER